ncbi:MAG: SUMO ligase siz1 [Icmadophila ericetorum]|nr:SUMO ligase siz1 [Icmadophila ericetorum]
MASTAPIDATTITAKVKTLINTQLKTVLKKEGLPVSGVKATMQDRIIKRINDAAVLRDVDALNRLKTLLDNPDGILPPTNRTQFPNIISPSTQHGTLMTSALPRPISFGPVGTTTGTNQGTSVGRPIFKESPFYTIIEPLTPVLECKAINLQPPVRETTRDHIEYNIILKPDVAEKLTQKESPFRAMVYCASEPISPFSRVDITFPHQVEISINRLEVKANLRGLKNKPGSTRPADITTELRRISGYENQFRFTYALTAKKFYVVVNLARQQPAQELVARLRTGKHISKEQVIREMISKAQDNDIIATSSIMSLKCPLSTLRIDVPCRSVVCTHNQCFDALSFLQLQEQAPTWTCPVCNKVVSFDQLQVDQYVDDILKFTPRSIEQVTVEPDGKWLQVSPSDNLVKNNGHGGDYSSGEEELIEIHDKSRPTMIKDENLLTPASMTRTPPYSSREHSLGSTAPRPSNGKRTINQVIDLTASDDEEQQPVRAKRPTISNETINLPRFQNTLTNGTINSLPRPGGPNLNHSALGRPPGNPSLQYTYSNV